MVQIVIPPFMKDKARPDHRKREGKSLKAKNGPPNLPSENSKAKSAAGIAVIKIGKSIKAIESDYRRRLQEAIGQLYREAMILRTNPDAWEEFRADKRLWKIRKPPKPNADILREVINLAVHSSDRASLYYRAVKMLFDADVSPEKVPAAIEEGGGLQAMADKYAETRRPARYDGDKACSASMRSRKPKFKARFDISESDLQELPEQCDVTLYGTIKRTESGKYELNIVGAVKMN